MVVDKAKRLFRAFAAAALVCLCTASWVHAEGVSVSASVEPREISVGQSAVYMIRLVNTRTAPDLDPPQVEGLTFDSPGQRSMTNIVNFERRDELQLTFRVTAEEEGVYRIPGRTLKIRGEEYTVEEVVLRVTPMDASLRNLFELVLERPERPLYIGEAVPATLKLRLREDVRASLGGAPERSGDAFVQSEWTREPRQGTETVGGRRFRFAAWDVVLNPVRAGTQTLRYRLPLVYENPDRMERDFFGRPRPQQDRTTLTTGTLEIDVRHPPAENRPDAFRDAIGRFEVDAALSERTVRAGEPVTLTVSLTGRGNFERMGAPELGEAPGWRVYPPRTRFEADDRDPRGLSGTKFFEYLIIPENEEVSLVPEFTFAHFDPDRRRYYTTIFDPEPVEVLPGIRTGLAARDFRPVDGTGRELAPPAALRPIKSLPGGWRAALTPPVATVRFWAGMTAPLLALGVLAVWLRRRERLRADSRHMRLRHLTRAARDNLALAEAAARSGNAPAFYAAAQRTLQETAARLDTEHRQPHSLVEQEVRELFQTAGGDDALDTFTATVFQISDAGKYAGALLEDRDLAEDARALRDHIERISRNNVRS
ncbi:MAG: protein BatD [Opitutales bacterium]|nr:protein BatD [Opitutales bacterium]